jgi:hypothetical protein
VGVDGVVGVVGVVGVGVVAPPAAGRLVVSWGCGSDSVGVSASKSAV